MKIIRKKIISSKVIATNELSQCSDFWKFTVSAPPLLLLGLEKLIDVEEKEDIELIVKVK